MTRSSSRLDCVVVGYNEMPFPRLEETMRRFGARSAAYRDLRLSFVEAQGRPQTWIDLLNGSAREARRSRGLAPATRDYHCGDIPNLAAVYLTAFLRRHGLRAEYVNLFQIERDWFAELLEQGPRCVAITTTFYVTNHPAREIVDFVKERRPDVPVIIGGPLVANHARRYPDPVELQLALDDLGADIYVADSQGEHTLVRVASCLRDGGTLGHVPNLLLPGDAGVQRTRSEPESNSLDENAIDWAATLRPQAGATLQTRTARSCAFKCAFCAYPTRAGGLTLASLETVERELDSMLNYGGVRNVVFVDDTFNVPLPRFKQLCRRLIARAYPFRWYSYFRCNNSDEETIDLMARSGCAGVFLGIESGSQPVLEAMNKAVTVEQYRRGARQLREHGITTFASFIIGFPGETRDTVAETVDFVRTLGVDYYRMQMWYCEPGTPVDQRREELGLQGTGFNWRHRTMDAVEAMEHVEHAMVAVQEACWLPQWSFDFWILPYLEGRGVPAAALELYLREAHQLLRLEHTLGTAADETRRAQHLARMAELAGAWCGEGGT
jgi:p-methyltransferase